MIIVKSSKFEEFYLVEFTEDSFIYTSIDEDFVLVSEFTSQIPLVAYNGDGSFSDFREFVLNCKPA